MGNILEALAYNNLRVEADMDKRSPEYKRINRKMGEYQDKLIARLDEEGKQLFDKYQDLQGRESSCYAVERFIRGFRLGATIMAESLMQPEEFIQGRGSCDIKLSKAGGCRKYAWMVKMKRPKNFWMARLADRISFWPKKLQKGIWPGRTR